MNARTFNREAARWAEERTALLGDRRRLARALEDAIARLALDRTDTRMLGFPETREEGNGRALLEELCVQAPHAARSPDTPVSAIPLDGGAS